MKKIILLTALAFTFVSCHKEDFTEYQENNEALQLEVSGQPVNDRVDCYYFFDTNNVSGLIQFFKGQELDFEYQLTPADLRDTLFIGGQKAYYFHFNRLMNFNELESVNGWCHINIFLENSTSIIRNENYYKNKMTYTSDYTGFLEPSTVIVENTNILLNSFWINYLPEVFDVDENSVD